MGLREKIRAVRDRVRKASSAKKETLVEKSEDLMEETKGSIDTAKERAELYESILQRHPNHAETVIALIRVYDTMGEKRIAQQYRARLDELKPLYIEHFKQSEEGKTASDLLHWDDTTLHPDEITAGCPSPDDWFYSTYDADDAEKDDAEWHFRVAADSIMKGEIDVAREFLQVAFMLNSDVELFVSVSEEYVDYYSAEAIVLWKLGLEFLPESGPLYSCLGSTHLLRKEFMEAVAAFSESVKYDPNEPNNYWDIAEAYIDLGRLDDAEAMWKILQKLDIKKANKLAYEISNARKGIRIGPADLADGIDLA